MMTRGPERRSGVERRVAGVVPRVVGPRDRRSGVERRRRYDLDERWERLVEAVRTEFWRLLQDPDAVFEPVRSELKLRARVDRPGQDAEWLAVTLTPGQVLNGDLATQAREFVALCRREREDPTRGPERLRGPERRSGVERRVADVVLAVHGERGRRSGEERRSGTDRRSAV